MPGIAQTWRWGFYNSNAFYKPSDDVGKGMGKGLSQPAPAAKIIALDAELW